MDGLSQAPHGWAISGFPWMDYLRLPMDGLSQASHELAQASLGLAQASQGLAQASNVLASILVDRNKYCTNSPI